MEKLSDKEIEQIINNAGFPKGLTFTQMIKIAYWSMFNRKRLNQFCVNIKKGKSIYFAFRYSKN